MPNRIDIELTSARDDGSWTWRAAGAKEPRGVLDGSILPSNASVGDELKVEAEYGVDGISVLAVVPQKEKPSRRSEVLELLPVERSFEPVTQQRAKRQRGGDRRQSRRRDGRDDRARDGEGRRRDDRDGQGRRRDEGRRRPHRSFTPPPEVPKRPKPKRLRPGKARRKEVLAELPEAERPIAELALQGLSAVRQRLREENAALRAAGKPEMPEASVMSMAERLLPKLRVADWLDRAEAAKRQMDNLDLRDLRSVVASSDDPIVARDESTRELAAEMKQALAAKQEEELSLWLDDVRAALDVGRVIRALRLSSQPPKAGVPFPGDLATRLAEATNESMLPDDSADRWAAVLEAAAFSPVRTLIRPKALPEKVTDELKATVKRLGPLLPQVAEQFGIEIPPDAPAPKPLRPARPQKRAAKKSAAPTDSSDKSAAQGSAASTKRSGAAASDDTSDNTAPERQSDHDETSDGAASGQRSDQQPAEAQSDRPAPDETPESSTSSEESAQHAEAQASEQPTSDTAAEPVTAAEPETAAEPDTADTSAPHGVGGPPTPEGAAEQAPSSSDETES